MWLSIITLLIVLVGKYFIVVIRKPQVGLFGGLRKFVLNPNKTCFQDAAKPATAHRIE